MDCNAVFALDTTQAKVVIVGFFILLYAMPFSQSYCTAGVTVFSAGDTMALKLASAASNLSIKVFVCAVIGVGERMAESVFPTTTDRGFLAGGAVLTTTPISFASRFVHISM